MLGQPHWSVMSTSRDETLTKQGNFHVTIPIRRLINQNSSSTYCSVFMHSVHFCLRRDVSCQGAHHSRYSTLISRCLAIVCFSARIDGCKMVSAILHSCICDCGTRMESCFCWCNLDSYKPGIRYWWNSCGMASHKAVWQLLHVRTLRVSL